MNDMAARALEKRKRLFLPLALGVGIVYYVCNPNFLYYDIIGEAEVSLSERLGLERLPYAWIHTSDYTFRIASAFLHGRLGIDEKPPGWLTETWRTMGAWPYLLPTGFGGSIFLNGPLLLLAFRKGACDSGLKRMCWTAIGVLTLVLWIHGNPGGWQFSYRYAMLLLPWFFILLLETSRAVLTWLEVGLFIVSVAINAYAAYLFLWTDYVHP